MWQLCVPELEVVKVMIAFIVTVTVAITVAVIIDPRYYVAAPSSLLHSKDITSVCRPFCIAILR
jgi:hypothetical protein